MKKLLLAAFFCAPGTFTLAQDFSTSSMKTITLKEAYSLALAKSEDLAMLGEGIKQLEQAEARIKASFRPSLSFIASGYKEQNSGSSDKAYLSAGYNLFSGMRDYISARAAAARTGAAGLELKRAAQTLYLDLARAYLDLVRAQRAVFIRIKQMAVDDRRIAELESRAGIGRSRASEVTAARSQLAQDKAAFLEALLNERLAQQTLKFLTGLEEDLSPSPADTGKKESLESFLGLAASRPDVLAKNKLLEYAERLGEAEKRNAWPTLDLSADYYLLRRPEPSPENSWNAGLTLRLPIYSGGYLKARKEDAGAAENSAKLALNLAVRQAASEIKSAYEEFKFISLQTESFEEALALARENAARQLEDYKLGLVTNLDVISALNTAVQTELALSESRSRKDFSRIKLGIAAGLELK